VCVTGLKYFTTCLLLVAAVSCSSDFVVGVADPPLELSGFYAASEVIGELGLVVMELQRVEDTSIYRVGMIDCREEDPEVIGGAGTVGDKHLILNFNPGSDPDFYFEGAVILNAGLLAGLEGQFVFPDRAETLRASFQWYELEE